VSESPAIAGAMKATRPNRVIGEECSSTGIGLGRRKLGERGLLRHEDGAVRRSAIERVSLQHFGVAKVYDPSVTLRTA